MRGRVKGIYIAPQAGGAPRTVEEVKAIPGAGLEGDRYAAKAGSFSGDLKPGREVTLIEAEAVAGLADEYGVEIAPGDARRNIVTEGVALNHLVGREFAVGGVVLRGVRLCEPCGHLESLTAPGVKRGLVHRGGLRADIVSGGVIRVGDPVEG